MASVNVRFKVRFDLTATPKQIIVTDQTQYAGNSSLSPKSSIRGIITAIGPLGIFYNNTNYATPDITPFYSLDNSIVIPLPLDPKSGYKKVLPGNYSIKYSIKNLATGIVYTKTSTFSFSLTEPVISAEIISGPYSGILRSTDTTNYGSHVDTLTRVHTLKYPAILSMPDIVSSSDYVQVTPHYTNQWTIIIDSTVLYVMPDLLEILWHDSETFLHCVYGSCIDSLYNMINAMFQQYLIYIDSNAVKAEIYRKKLIQINTAWQLLEIAYKNNNLLEADQQAAIIQEAIGESDCSVTSSVQVVPCPAFSGGGGGGGEVYTFHNGLTEISNDVVLGGSLDEATLLGVSNFGFDIEGSGGPNSVRFSIAVGSGVFMESVNSGYSRQFAVNAGKLSIYYNHGATTREYIVGDNGLVEEDDYSSTYSDRSLISKAYFVANNNWGAQVVETDDTLIGDGTSGNHLKVATPFPGFGTLAGDYGYTKPSYDFSEINAKPDTIAGYGITDAWTKTELSTPSSGVEVDWTNIANVPASSGWVPDTGGTFTGQVIIETHDDHPLILRALNAVGTIAVPDPGTNLIEFQDHEHDIQGVIGIDAGGNIALQTFVGGADVIINNNAIIDGDLTVTGAVNSVDIAAFKATYDIHTHPFSDITATPTTLVGYGITDAMSADQNTWPTEFAVKSAGVSADRMVIEDSADSYKKKYVLLNHLPAPVTAFIGLTDVPSGYSGADDYFVKVNHTGTGLEFLNILGAFLSTADGTIDALTEKVSPVDADIVLIEDSAASYSQKKVLLSHIATGGSMLWGLSGGALVSSDTSRHLLIGEIDEVVLNAGVTIEGVLLKDNKMDFSFLSNVPSQFNDMVRGGVGISVTSGVNSKIMFTLGGVNTALANNSYILILNDYGLGYTEVTKDDDGFIINMIAAGTIDYAVFLIP